MFKNFWKSLPITLICVSAYAATTPPAASTTSTAKAPAAPAAAGTSTMAAPAPAANPTSFGLVLEAGYEVQAYQQTNKKTGAKTRSESLSYGFTPSMKFGDGYKLSSYWEYDQTLTDSTDSGWIDPSVSLSRKAWELGKYIKMGPSATIVLPMSEDTKNDVNLKFAASGKVTTSLNTANMGLDAFSLSYGLQYTRYFTDYSTKLGGDPVTQQRIRQDIHVGYQIIDPLSLDLFFRHDSKYSVEGVVRGGFIMQQTLEYAINDSLAVSVSHANAGATIRKDDQENYQNAIQFDDVKNTTYSVGMSLSI